MDGVGGGGMLRLGRASAWSTAWGSARSSACVGGEVAKDDT